MLSSISRFFLFCSGVSRELILKCPTFEVIKYTTIGVTIFFTTILAFISSFYALSLISENVSLILLGALFWALIIFNLDRYIVISLRPTESLFKNFILASPRIVIAIIVAIVISKPIEIKLFENEIENFHYSFKSQNIKELENKANTVLSSIEQKKSKLESKYVLKKEIVDRYEEDYLCEAAGTCGTLVKGRGPQFQSRKDRWLVEKKMLAKEQRKKDSLINLENLKAEKINAEYSNAKANIMGMKFGFFDKVSALNKVNKSASYFILLLFILVEASPVLTKMLSKKGPYDALVLKSEIKYESDYLESLNEIETLKSKREKFKELNNDIDLKEAEITLNMKKNGLKNISRQEAFNRYEKLKKEVADEK